MPAAAVTAKGIESEVSNKKYALASRQGASANNLMLGVMHRGV